MQLTDISTLYACLRTSLQSGIPIDEEQILALFRWQANHNLVYCQYLKALGKSPENIVSTAEIPFLPIELFKTQEIICGPLPHNCTYFESSTTTGTIPSKHHVPDLTLYEETSIRLFERQYGSLNDYTILALLPSYVERSASSLVYMIHHFMKQQNHRESGFFIRDYPALKAAYQKARDQNRQVLLIGVSFALLDFAENGGLKLHQNDVLMETGGMKGRRSEMIREALHEKLKWAFGVNQVHSEYGMTELLSQAYAPAAGQFICPPSMRIYIRQTDDPFKLESNGRTGGVNVIDFANIHSCAFIQTQDLGRKISENTFEILGRFDSSEIRGCNLMTI